MMNTNNYILGILCCFLFINSINATVFTNCTIEGTNLVADTCDNSTLVYQFNTQNSTYINGYFKIPLNYKLVFNGPLIINPFSTLEFNCKPSTQSRIFCRQLYSSVAIVETQKYSIVNIDYSLVDGASDVRTYYSTLLFGTLDETISYDWLDSNNYTSWYVPRNLVYVNMTFSSPNTIYSYYRIGQTLSFSYGTPAVMAPVSPFISVNITTNCLALDDSLYWDLISKFHFQIKGEMIYHDSLLNREYLHNETTTYIFVNVYPQYNNSEITLKTVLDMLPNYANELCNLKPYGIKTKYKIEVGFPPVVYMESHDESNDNPTSSSPSKYSLVNTSIFLLLIQILLLFI